MQMIGFKARASREDFAMDFIDDVHDERTILRWSYPPPQPVVDASARASARMIDGALHTLRTRLTTVKGYGQLLGRLVERPVLEQDSLVTLMTELNVEIGSLEEVVQQFLAACRLQWDTRPLDWNAVDLATLVDQAVERVAQPPLATTRHRLEVDASSHITGIWDARWLGEALAAIVMNALRYSPDGGPVHISVARVGERATVTVRDHGLGILPPERERIFLPFEVGSAHERVSGVPGGWGLGLFVAGRVVEAHGAQLRIESAPGIGSTFTLMLPLAPQPTTTVAD
jgi:two-component system phosphate regulon sensor histidine kinase PhoR